MDHAMMYDVIQWVRACGGWTGVPLNVRTTKQGAMTLAARALGTYVVPFGTVSYRVRKVEVKEADEP